MDIELNQRNKQLVWNFWQALEKTRTSDETVAAVTTYLDESAVWHGPDPVGDLAGPSSFARNFWGPLRESFAPLTRQTHLFFGGESNGKIDGTGSEGMWVTGTGNLTGVFTRDYLSIPATGAEVSMRWGEFCRIADARIVEIYFLVDLIDLMEQSGFRVLPVSRGRPGMYPPPRAGDGVLLDEQKEEASSYSLTHIRRFIFDGLNAFDQSNLASMGMANYFHPGLRWYGPGGIGACLSFEEFETLHQRPWLHAFPDRAVQDLDALIAEGAYSGGPGWAGVKATHKGEYLGCPATVKPIEVNGLDWWKRENEQLVENWVFVDMIHLFRQFGVDLMARLAEQVDAR